MLWLKACPRRVRWWSRQLQATSKSESTSSFASSVPIRLLPASVSCSGGFSRGRAKAVGPEPPGTPSRKPPRPHSSMAYTQNGGSTSSLKFSYWSSAKMTMNSGANSSMMARARRQPAMASSRCALAALSASSSPHSFWSSIGQFAGSRSSAGVSGLARVSLKYTLAMVSSVSPGCGPWNIPMPMISAIAHLPRSRKSLVPSARLPARPAESARVLDVELHVLRRTDVSCVPAADPLHRRPDGLLRRRAGLVRGGALGRLGPVPTAAVGRWRGVDDDPVHLPARRAAVSIPHAAAPATSALGEADGVLGPRVVEADDLVGSGIAHERHRLLAPLDPVDLLGQHAAEQGDATVARPEVLLGTVGDPALRLPRHLVLHLEGQHVVAAVLRATEVAREHLHLPDLGLGVRVHPLGRVEPHLEDVGVLVVDRDAPVQQVVAHAVTDPQHVREDERRADLDARVVAPVHDGLRDAPLAALEVVAHDRALVVRRPDAVRLAGREAELAQHVGVQVVRVRRVGRVLLDLEPVALERAAQPERAPAVAHHEHVPARQERRRLGAKVGEEEPAQTLHGVGVDADPPLVGLRRLERLLDALPPVVGELPPVVGAADAVRLEEAVAQRAGPVRALLREERVLARGLQRQDEVLAEDSEAHHRSLGADLVRQRDGLPVATEQVAAGGAGADPRQALVHLLAQHGALLDEVGGTVCLSTSARFPSFLPAAGAVKARG